MENIITITVTEEGVVLKEKHLKPLPLSQICIFGDNGKGICRQYATELKDSVTLDVRQPLTYAKDIPGKNRAFLYCNGERRWGSLLYLHRDIVGQSQPSVEKTSSNAMTLTWSAEKLPLIFTQHIQLFEKERYALTYQSSPLSTQMGSAVTTGNLVLLSTLYRKLRKIAQKNIELQARANAYTPEDFIRDHPELVSKAL